MLPLAEQLLALRSVPSRSNGTAAFLKINRRLGEQEKALFKKGVSPNLLVSC
jgi:hypothetical protein